MTDTGRRAGEASATGADASEWFRAALACAPDEGFVMAGGVRIRYRAWGSPGPGVVLVHGVAASSRWWDHVGPLLSPGLRVVALDLSGHGDSGRRDAYSLETWSDEILEAGSARTGIAGRPVVVGHSLGGYAALLGAVRHPDAFGGVIAVDSPVRELTAKEIADRAARPPRPHKVYPTREDALARFRPIPVCEHPLPYVLSHVAATAVEEVPGGWSWRFDPKVMEPYPLSPRQLVPLRCPVALINAAEGDLSPAMTDEINGALGWAASVAAIPAASHHVMLDQPVALAASLLATLGVWRVAGGA